MTTLNTTTETEKHFHARLRSAFDRLVNLEQSAQQLELATLAQSDALLSAELAKLLRHSALLDNESSELDRNHEKLGAYQLHEVIGQGGMGVVYRASRLDDSFSQTVAVKRLAFNLQGMSARFLRERQILARLEHPNIARLIDGGADSSGHAWLAMEYVQGKPITLACDAQNASIRRRIALIKQLALAVQHAHSCLIVHRDIKPGNVLVSDSGELKLLDFGIAKMLEEASDPVNLEQSVYALTPAYAAPEQLERKPATTASDIYAIGLLLHELISGLKRKSIDMRAEATSTSYRVSLSWEDISATQLKRIAEQRALDVAGLLALGRSDLARIIAKATASDPAQRYATPTALSDDLQRYCEHRPILARAPSLPYTVARFVRRNFWACASTGLALLALCVSALIAVQQAQLERVQRVRADQQTAMAQAQTHAAQDAAREARSEAHSHELLREHFVAVLARTSKEKSLDADQLMDLVATMPRQSTASDQRTLALALAGIFNRQSDPQRTMRVLDAAADALREGSTSEQAKAANFRAQALMLQGDVAAAQQQSNTLAGFQQSRPESSTMSASMLQLKGVLLLNSGDVAGATPLLEQAVGLLPEFAKGRANGDALAHGALLANLSIAYLKSGRLVESINLLDRIDALWLQAGVGQNSQTSAVANARGFALMAQGRVRAALLHYESLAKTLTQESGLAKATRQAAHARALLLGGQTAAALDLIAPSAASACQITGASANICARMYLAAADIWLASDQRELAQRALDKAAAGAKDSPDRGSAELYRLTEALLAYELQPDAQRFEQAERALLRYAQIGDGGYRALEYALHWTQRLQAAGRKQDAQRVANIAIKLGKPLDLPADSQFRAQLAIFESTATGVTYDAAAIAVAHKRAEQLMGVAHPWLKSWAHVSLNR